ncbi:MAG: hypothetical protein K1X82_10245 [Bacteroidia bacterium]|nr:hypothetical protein [Bacteroidia bacterium]
MKLKPVLLTLGAVFCLAASALSQGDSATSKPKRVRPPYEPNKWPSISLGVGQFAFNGDIGTSLKVMDFSNFRMTYRLDIEQRFYSAFGVQLSGMYGKMARNERTNTRNLNFENTVMQGELNVILYLDNNLFINRSSKFSPYLYGGVGYMMFTQKTDSLDKNGEAYNYWSDGTIRTRPQTQDVIQGGGNSYITQLDRKYETSVKVATPNALVFPMGLGLRYKFSNLFYGNFQAAYYMTMSDLIDNVKAGGNDSYVYVGTSFTYNIGMKGVKKEPTEFDDVDFASYDKEDDDGDGVKNNTDECGATPEGVKVDERGCPLDADKDGVPDYMDDEKASKEGAVVDAKGVTIPEEGPGMSKDSVASDHTRLKEIFPSMKDEMVGTYFSSEKPQKVSASGAANSGNTLNDFKFVDTNGDGYISSDEISSAIDAFFEGESQLKSSDINRLIDFFFEQ